MIQTIQVLIIASGVLTAIWIICKHATICSVKMHESKEHIELDKLLYEKEKPAKQLKEVDGDKYYQKGGAEMKELHHRIDGLYTNIDLVNQKVSALALRGPENPRYPTT